MMLAVDYVVTKLRPTLCNPCFFVCLLIPHITEITWYLSFPV